jgi:hypothetical protein
MAGQPFGDPGSVGCSAPIILAAMAAVPPLDLEPQSVTLLHGSAVRTR